VRAAARIDLLAGDLVALKPAGPGALKGLCPFHDERTASFTVKPGAGLWYCFGCGEGGDVIGFAEKTQALTFAEAVEYLAGRFGVPLETPMVGAGPPGAGRGPSKLRLLEANRVAAVWYQERLVGADARPARDFLRSRGFDRPAAEMFAVGYAPEGWDGLLRHLRGKGFTDSESRAAGLTVETHRGPADRFRGRLVWPIRDLTGQTVAFGARKLADERPGPKYLNSPETALYGKSRTLYGADLAKTQIGRRRRAVVVEGYTDVMACHLAGLTETVATCGTAFGEGHIRVLRRLLADSPGMCPPGAKVVFAFDGDDAGRKAALRAFAGDQRFWAQTFTAVTPPGEDPCGLWARAGPGPVLDLVDDAEPMFRFALRAALAETDLSTAEGRAAGLRAGAAIVAGVRDDLVRADYARQLAVRTGADPKTADKIVREARRAAAPARAGRTRPPAVPPAPADPVARVERAALAAVLQRPDLAPGDFDQLGGDVFQTPALRAVHDAVRAAGGVKAGAGDPRAWLAAVRQQAARPALDTLTWLAVEPLPVGEEDVARYVAGAADALSETALTRRIGGLVARVGQIGGELGGPGDREALLCEVCELTARRAALRDRRHSPQPPRDGQ
jgi:DNA primase